MPLASNEAVCDPQAVRGSRPSSGGLDRGSRPGRALSRRRQRGLASAGRECRRAGPISRPPPAAPARGAARSAARAAARRAGPTSAGRTLPAAGPDPLSWTLDPLDTEALEGGQVRRSRPTRPLAYLSRARPTPSASRANKGATDRLLCRRGCLIKGSSRAIISFPVPPYGEGRGICN